MDEPPGFREFVAGHQGALLRLAWSLTGDRQRGEDLAQVALVRLWERWGHLIAGVHPWPYLRKVTVSIYLTGRRRRWNQEDPVARPPDMGAADGEFGVAAGLESVAGWLEQLGPRQRAVIVLRFLTDLSVDDTAEVLGCSAGTVKSQSARALATLRSTVPATNPRRD